MVSLLLIAAGGLGAGLPWFVPVAAFCCAALFMGPGNSL